MIACYTVKIYKKTPSKMFQPGGACPTLWSWIHLWIMFKISTLNSISEDLNFSEFKALTSLMIVKFNSQETASAIHFDIDAVQSIM